MRLTCTSDPKISLKERTSLTLRQDFLYSMWPLSSSFLNKAFFELSR